MKFDKRLYVVLVLLAARAAWVRADGPQTQPAGGVSDVSRPAPKLVPAPNDLLDKVQNELHKMRSIEADFSELIYPKDHKDPQLFRGHLAAKEPNTVIWRVESPVHIIVRVQGEDVRIWDGDKPNEVEKKNLAGNPTYKVMAQQTRDWAGGNFKVLSESYDVFVEQNEPLTLRFIPKPRTGLAKTFSSVSATLGPGYGSIIRIVYRKSTGEVYAFTLKDPKVNTPIPDKVWEVPPK